jgi:hypothetical protein
MGVADMTTRGISVEDLRKAVDPVTAPKVLVLRGQRSFEDEDNAWAVDQVLRRLKMLIPDMELADVALPSYRLLSHVSNDPDDSAFSPEDQLPLVMEPLKKANVVIVASAASCGFPTADLVRLVERLAVRQKTEDSEPMFNRKLLSVIVTGNYGTYDAAKAVAGAFVTFGFSLARRGFIFWEDGLAKGALPKDKALAVALDRVAVDISDSLGSTK